MGAWYHDGDANEPAERVGRYGYDGLFRRVAKEVANQGDGVVQHSDDGGLTGIAAGDRHEQFYYAGWRLVETRSAAGHTLGQFAYGTQYVDEPLRRGSGTPGMSCRLPAGRPWAGLRGRGANAP